MASSKKNQYTPIQIIILVICVLFFGREELLSNFEDAYSESYTPPSSVVTGDGNFTYHVIDVGQGDCTFLLGEEKNLLIDGGENGKGDAIVAYLKSIGVDHIDYMIGTHAHSDHIGGLDEVMEEMSTTQVFMPDIPDKILPTTQTFYSFLDTAEETGAEMIVVTEPITLDLGGGAVVSILPTEIVADNANDTSLYTITTYGDVDFFSSGDAEKDSELSMLATPGLSDVEVMKLGHHGSTTSNTKELLAVIQPTSAFVCCGLDNSYGHPHDEIVELLEKYVDYLPRTDLQGSFYYSTDGTTLTLHTVDGDFDIEVK